MDSMVHSNWEKANLLIFHHHFADGDGKCGDFNELQSVFDIVVFPKSGYGSQC